MATPEETEIERLEQLLAAGGLSPSRQAQLQSALEEARAAQAGDAPAAHGHGAPAPNRTPVTVV